MSREERQSPSPRFRADVTPPGSGRRLVASVAGSSLQGGGLPAPRFSPPGALRRGREAVFAVSPAHTLLGARTNAADFGAAPRPEPWPARSRRRFLLRTLCWRLAPAPPGQHWKHS
ncbi:unnamed protein product [Natator depressus]